MANYHINPATGVDTNTGLSWAQAWKTPNGLRVNAIVMVAGDKLKIAKSTLTTGFSGDQIPSGLIPDSGIFFGGATAWTYTSRRATAVVNFPQVYWASGTWATAITWQSFPTSVYPADARSTTGAWNVPSRKIAWQFSPNVNFNGKRTVWMWFRVTVPYAGAGDIDIPPGTFSVSFCSDASGNTPLITMTVDCWIKNTGEWALFRYEHGSNFTTLGAFNSVVLSRTAQTLTRDNTAFGLSWSPMLVGELTPDHSLDYVFKIPYQVGAFTPDYVLSNTVHLVAERLYPVHGMVGSGTLPYVLPRLYSPTAVLSLTERYTAYPVATTAYGMEYVGTANWPVSGLGSTGVYDLNGSLGGTLASPVIIEGGWNTGTDLVDGHTVYTGRTPQEYGQSCALFDLGNADHIEIRNISAIYGFGRLINNTKTITLDKCHTPMAHKGGVNTLPPLGTPSTALNCTLKNMVMPDYTFEYIGVIGNMTLQNFLASTYEDRSPLTYVEVENLTLDAAHVGRRDYTEVYNWHFSVRMDAELIGCVINQAPRIVNRTIFGRTMTVRNVKAWGAFNSSGWRLIPTLPDSRWGTIVYRNNAFGSGQFTAASTTLPSSADRRIEFKDNTSQPLLDTTFFGSAWANTEVASILATTGFLRAGFYYFTTPDGGEFSSPGGIGRYYSFTYKLEAAPQNAAYRWSPLWSNQPFEEPGITDSVTVGRENTFIVGRHPSIFYRSGQSYFLVASDSRSYPGSPLATAYVEAGKTYKIKLGCQYKRITIGTNSNEPPWMTVGFGNQSFVNEEQFVVVLRGPGVVSGMEVSLPHMAGPYDDTANAARNEWEDLEWTFSTIAEGEVTIYLHVTHPSNGMSVLIDTLNVELA